MRLSINQQRNNERIQHVEVRYRVIFTPYLASMIRQTMMDQDMALTDERLPVDVLISFGIRWPAFQWPSFVSQGQSEGNICESNADSQC